jgi:hypothetical protein
MSILHSKWCAFGLLVLGLIASNFIGAWAYAPFLLTITYHYAYPPFYGTKSVSVVKAELIEKIRSVVRTVIQFLGLLTALGGFGVKIPYIDAVGQALQYIASNLGVAADAFNVLAGFVITIYGFFLNSQRFESRTDNPHRDYKLEN